MTFQPVVPLSGYAGWRFLERTMGAQQDAFSESRPVARLTDHFRSEIGKVTSLDDFMADRRLLEVALGAYGLDEDLGNTAFIRKVLSEGTIREDAFANRLGDKRYAAFSKAMGFGDYTGAGKTQFNGFAEDLIARYEARQFARAVGESDNDMRLALNLSSSVDAMLESQDTLRSRWFALMGDPPLRSVFEKALGFGTGFGQIDIDQQLDQFRARSKEVFGTDDPADFADPALQEQAIRLFLIRAESERIQINSPASVALTLLQSTPNLNATPLF